MHEHASTTREAWYRNGWVWLVIGIPAATVAGCFLTIWLALTHPDERVREPATANEMRNP
jgi:uncharacterized protein